MDSMTQSLLIGISVGSLALMSILVFIRWTKEELVRMQEIADLHIIGRTVGMALRSIIDTLKDDDWLSSKQHISISKQRLDRFTPTFTESRDAYLLLKATVDYMEVVIELAELGKWSAAHEVLLESAKTYNLFMDYVKQMLDSSKNEQP